MKINDILRNLDDVKLFVDGDQKQAITCATDIIAYARDNDLIRDKKENPNKIKLSPETLEIVNDIVESVHEKEKDKNNLDILAELKKITGLLEHMQWCNRKYSGDDLK